ncbi:OprP Phosphate-selective porin [Methylophilaceae bacterium]
MNFNKKLAAAVSSAVLLMAGQVALADSATDIVDALVSKGVLTEEEGKLITKGHTSKTAVTPVVKEKDGAFILESANARNSIQLTGRMHLDYRDIDNDGLGANNAGDIDKDGATGASQFELRRARLGVKGKFAKYFNYEVVGNLPGTATIDVAFLDFAKYDQMQLRVGKFKQPFNLEEQTSSNNIDFLERSYVNQTAPGKKLGAMLFGEPKPGLTYAGSIFQMNDVENDAKSEDLSFAGRGTLNFAELMGNKDAIYHVGLAGYNNSSAVRPTSSSASSGSKTTAGTFLSYRTPGRGLSNIFRAQIQGDTLTTDTVQSAISDSTADIDTKGYGLEAIAAYNSFKVQGEYTRGDAKANYKNGTGNMSLDNEAYYAEALWLLTGEKYSSAYKKGAFGSIKPMKEFDLDNFSGYGAWELGLRYEAFDVSDTERSGSGLANGSRFQGTLNCNGTSSSSSNSASTSTAASGCKAGAQTYTAGIKWILNPNVMVKAAYSRTNYDDAFAQFDVGSSGVNGGLMKHEDILSIRSQFTF